MIFVRYVVMHRSISWRLRRVGQANTYLLHDQRGKLLIHILKKLQKMVSASASASSILIFFCWQHNINDAFLQCQPILVSALALVSGSFQSSSVEPKYILKPDSSSVPASFISAAAMSSRADNSIQAVNFSQGARGLNSDTAIESLDMILHLVFLFMILFATGRGWQF